MLTPKVKNGDIPEAEIQAYVKMIREQYPDVTDGTVEITIDGDFVELDLVQSPIPFQRIRRITGYLVGTLDRFNNAKRCEVEDRVKHGVSG